MQRLIAGPLTAEAFASFGDVLAAPSEPGRHFIEAALANHRPGVGLSLSFTRKAPSSLPMTSTTMERHELSSQSFIPMQNGPMQAGPMQAGRWVCIVAPHAAAGGPDMARARAFLGRADQGITFGLNVWHHPFTVLDRPADFAIVMWRDGSARDEEFVTVERFEIDIPVLENPDAV